MRFVVAIRGPFIVIMMTAPKFEEVFGQLVEVVRAKLNCASSCHDFDHTLRVLRNAEMLTRELPEADWQIVQLATLLHDFARPEEMAEKGRICHAELGAKLIRPLLFERGVDSRIVDQVSQAVLTHRFRKARTPATIEAKIVFDADKLDALGAVGIGRAFLFAGHANARLHNTRNEALNSAEYSREDTAYREYLVKLKNLPERMLTSPGYRIALERVKFMHEFFARLNGETGL